MPRRSLFSRVRFLAVVIGGCKRTAEVAPFAPVDSFEFADHSSLAVDARQSRELVRDSMIGVASSLGLAGKWLVVSDFSGQPFLHVVNRIDGKVAVSTGRLGEGPGDFASAPIVVPAGGAVDYVTWLLDLGRQRVSALDLRAVDAGADRPLFPTTFFIGSVLRMTSLHDSSFIGVVKDSLGDGISLVKFTGRQRTVLGPIRHDDARSGLLGLDLAYSKVSLCSKPDRSRIAIPYYNAGRIDLYDTNGAVVGHADVPFRGVPEETVDKEGRKTVKLRAGAKLYYYGCIATPNYFYTQFVNVMRGARGYVPERSHTFVHVFRWDGALARVIRLDHGTEMFTVDQRDSELYSVKKDSVDIPELRVTIIR